MAKRGRLSEFTARKERDDVTSAPPRLTPVQAAMPSEQATKGQTLRLNVPAWRQLKILAIDRGQPVHDLLVEAVDDLFVKYGVEPIARKLDS